MKYFEKISAVKPENNEYIFLKNNPHDTKPRKILYLDSKFIDFNLKEVATTSDSLWRPVYSRNPITKEKCEILITKKETPMNAEIDALGSNEYFTTYHTNGKKYLYIHEGAEIKSMWTKDKL